LFTRVGMEIQGAQGGLKCYIFYNKLHDDCKLKEELGLWSARDMSELLTCAQPYINYEEKRLGEETLQKTIMQRQRRQAPQRQRRDKKLVRLYRLHPLNLSRETIL